MLEFLVIVLVVLLAMVFVVAPIAMFIYAIVWDIRNAVNNKREEEFMNSEAEKERIKKIRGRVRRRVEAMR